MENEKLVPAIIVIVLGVAWAIASYGLVVQNQRLCGRNQALRGDLSEARGRTAALRSELDSAPTPHSALPDAEDLDNWHGGLWKRVLDNSRGLKGFIGLPRKHAGFDEASWVQFDRWDPWKELSFKAIEFDGSSAADNFFSALENRLLREPGAKLYASLENEDLLRYSSFESDATVFRENATLFVVRVAGDNVGKWSSASYVRFMEIEAGEK